MKQNGRTFLFVLGSDKDIHFYEIDLIRWRLFRSSSAEVVKEFWQPKLGIGGSFGLRLLVEHWNGYGAQCIVGYADGYLYWNRTMRFDCETVNSESVQTEKMVYQQSNPLHDFRCAVLLDSAVTCLVFYNTYYTKNMRKMNLLNKAGISTASSVSPMVIVGLANGSLLVLSSTTGSLDQVVISGLDPCKHGPAMAIHIGSVLHGDIDNVIVGYNDGTIIVYSVHPEFFTTANNSIDNTGVINGAACSENIDSRGRYDFLSPDEALPSALKEEFLITLPFPIVSLHFGSFISEIEDASGEKGRVVLCDEQLAVLTTQGVHFFVYRY